jgi:uncharacterized membrane protein YcfT
VLFWLASVLLCLFKPPLGNFATWLSLAISNAPFFLLGAVVSGLRKYRPPVWLGLVAFAAFLGAVATSLHVPRSKPVHLMIGSAASLLLCCSIMSLEEPLLSRRPFTAIGGLGKASMAIYVSHTIFSAATRIVLVKAGITDIAIQMIIGTITGLLFPAGLYIMAKRAKILGALGIG